MMIDRNFMILFIFIYQIIFNDTRMNQINEIRCCVMVNFPSFFPCWFC